MSPPERAFQLATLIQNVLSLLISCCLIKQESIAAFKDFTIDDASGQKPKPKPKPKKEPKEEGKAKQKPDEGKIPKEDARAAPPPPKPSSGIGCIG